MTRLLLVLSLWLFIGVPAGCQSQDERAAIVAEAFRLDTDGRAGEARALLLPLVRAHDGGAHPDSTGAAALFTLGRTYLVPGQQAEAIPYLQAAVRLADRLGLGPNLRAKYRVRLSEATIVVDIDTTVRLVEEALPLFSAVRHPDTTFWARGLWNLARAHELRGDYAAGMSAIRIARTLAAGKADFRETDRFLIYYQAVQLISRLDPEHPEHLTLARRAYASSERTGDPYYRVFGYTILAQAQRKLGHYAAADTTLTDALRFLDDAPGLEYARGDALNLRSIVRRYRGEHGGAVADARAAAAVFRQYDPAYERTAQNTLGQALLAAGDPGAAADALARAFDLTFGRRYRTDGGRRYGLASALDSLNAHDSATRLYANRARVARQRGEFAGALRDLQASIGLMEEQRARSPLTESQYRNSDQLKYYYEQAIGVLADQAAAAPTTEATWEALLLSEAARGFSLLDEARRRQRTVSQRVPELRAAIARLEQRGGREVAVAQLRLELQQVLRDSSRRLPPPTPVTAGDLRRQLAELDRPVVEYFLGQDESFQFVYLPGEGLRLRRLIATDTLTELIRDWRHSIVAGAYRGKSLRAPAVQAKYDRTFATVGRRLYRSLLPALPPGTGELLIVPDGALQLLPFAALPAGEAERTRGGRATYLGDRLTPRYAYSLRHLRELADLPAPRGGADLAAFAPTFGGAAEPTEVLAALRGGADPAGGVPRLRPLRHNDAEVRSIAALFADSRLYVGPDADRKAFLGELGRAGVLHLSSHAVVDPARPRLSFLAFGDDPAAGRADGPHAYLYYNELTDLTTEAEMVVLAACETSMGKIVPGETVLSMASAFTTAGARSTVTTLWQVDDEATRRLMEAFYARLAAGDDRDEALAAAQRALRADERFAHPFYWAAPVLYGRAGPLGLRTTTGGWWVALVVLALLLTGLAWHLRTRPKKNGRPL